MRFRYRRLGYAGVALATAAATVTATPAHAANSEPSGSPHFTQAQLNKLSAKYTPRSDGTPGLVAKAQGDSSSSNPSTQKSAKATAAGSKNDNDVKGFVSKGSAETMRGSAETIALDGTKDWAAITTAGSIVRYDAQGHAAWRVGVHDLESAWQITSKLSSEQEDLTPVMYEGFNPYQPGATGAHPYAQLDANHDGVADIAVAYQLGVSPDAPFSTPGSDLSSGTFISVLDGQTGKMLWHKLVPGTVGSMTAQDGQLIAAESTGPDWNNNPVAEQGTSRSSLLSYTFSGSGTSVTGKQAWTYNTMAPYADWTDISTMGAGRVTVGWTDTPMGLGNPRPADGHVLVVDTKTGKAEVDVKTPGYPRIVQQDVTGDRVLVAEQNDPTDSVFWQVTAIDAKTGDRIVLATRKSAIPTSLIANPDPKKGQPTYVASELGINADLTDGASAVVGLDGTAKQLWSHTTSSSDGAAETPVLGTAYDPRGQGQVLVTTGDGVEQSLANPEGPYQTQLTSLAAADGHVAWQNHGSIAGDQITSYNGSYLTVGYDLTAYQTNIQGHAQSQPMLGDLYATDSYDVNGDGTPDLIVGGQSHGVFALDGKALANDQLKVLWQTSVASSVHGIQVAPVVDGSGTKHDRVVAATSVGFSVLNPTTGALVSDNNTGAFQYKAQVADGRILASSKSAFGAYDETGKALWTYRPSNAGSANVAYSAPAVSDDGVFLEYGGVRTSFGTGPSDPAPTAVSLDPATGKQRWTVQSAGEKSAFIMSQAGVYASPNIPGANGHGVAFGFGGNQPTSFGHTVLLIDGTDGKVVKTMTSSGANTFLGFTSSKDQGLLWLHTNMVSEVPPTGLQNDVPTMVNNFQGVYATAQDGSEVFVGGAGGVVSYKTPITQSPGDYYAWSTGSAFGYFAGSVTPEPLYAGKTTTMVALAQDNTAYNLNLNVGAFGADAYPTDAFPHGISVLQATGATAASGAKAAAPAPAAGSVGSKTPTAIKQNYLPIGTASAPHHVQSQVKASSVAASDIRGYTPQQIQKRLGLTGDGTGQTVAISIAYDYPTAEADVNTYSKQFNLPQTCGSAGADASDCFDFKVAYAEGTKPAQDSNWNEEAALDIETVHSIVPKAKIVLVEAKDASAAALYKAVDVADGFHPDAINNSWGMSEFSEESFYDDHCKLKDSVCTQSTGDAGWPAGYSSTNAYALAVGGTHMSLDADGNTTGESAWTSGGGGFSFFEKQPNYQQGVVDSSYRATPDVSFNADPQTGVAVYVTIDGTPYWVEVGGTSLSSPSWAGMIAAADQLRQADGKANFAIDGPEGDSLHKAVYSLGSALSDVTSGSNGGCGTECTAGPGYDEVTGMGSPVAGIDKALAAK